MRRRTFLGLAMAASFFRAPSAAGPRIVFPQDHGAHPQTKVEWWYVTGWLESRLGFQITFFRAHPGDADENPSRFAPRQILLAHAALADPARGHLLHEARAAREGFGLAQAQSGPTRVWIGDWQLALEGDRYAARIVADSFDFDFRLQPTRTVLQGDGGISRKGFRPEETSHYYSQPQMAVSGRLNGKPVAGTAWLDHEWSDAYLAPQAVGWDWTGINLFDGGALMAFRMRDARGGTYFAPPGVSIAPLRWWRSPRTGVRYPVSMAVNGLRLEPLMDDQELDVRLSTGTIYWEGAVTAFRGSEAVGRGYLELTGYWKPMKL